jgi:hypothetical protein
MPSGFRPNYEPWEPKRIARQYLLLVTDAGREEVIRKVQFCRVRRANLQGDEHCERSTAEM